MDVYAKRPAPNTSLIIHSEVVDPEQWFAFPFCKYIFELASLFIPLRERFPGHEYAAVRIEGNTSDKFALWDQRFDPSVWAATEHAATAHVTIVQPILIICPRPFE